MKPLTEQRLAVTGGTGRIGRAGIAEKDMPKMLSILSDQLYGDKIAAVVREYSCNAWDAHVAGGVPDKPISVTMPSVFVPEFVVRDFGPGLSEDRVFDHYMMFGASDKEDTNAVNGMFGLGCKAAYAYVTAFTIISHHGGKKSTYSAFIDGERQRIVAKMGEEDTDETGMEIRVPVQKDDIYLFRAAAQNIFQWFTPVPACEGLSVKSPKKTGTLLSGIQVQLLDWRALGLKSQWTATMGNVAYKLPLDQFEDALTEDGLLAFLQNASGVLHFDIGEVTPHPSREYLSIDRATKAAVLERLLLIRQHAIAEVEREIGGMLAAGASAWAVRDRALRALKEIHVKRSEILGIKLHGVVNLPEKEEDRPKTFLLRNLVRSGGAVGYGYTRRSSKGSYSLRPAKTLPLTGQGCRLVLQDCDRAVARLQDRAESIILLTPLTEDYSFDQKELDDLLKKLGVDGIPTRKLSTFAAPEAPVDHERRKSHYAKSVFTYKGRPADYDVARKSEQWAPYDGEIEKPVFVVIDHFIPDYPLESLRADELMLQQLFGLSEDMPTVLGVKPRAKALTEGGQHYRDWLRDRIRAGLKRNKLVATALRHYGWSGAGPVAIGCPSPTSVVTLQGSLGTNHVLTKLFKRMRKGADEWASLPTATKKNVARLLAIMVNNDSLTPAYRSIFRPLSRKLTAVLEQYPLLALEGPVSLEALRWVRPKWGTHANAAKRHVASLDYIKFVDRYRELIDENTQLKERLACLPSPPTS